MDRNLEQWILAADRRIRVLRIVCIAQFVMLIALAASGILTKSVHAGVSADMLRVRGLVVEDAKGRARILIGAPFVKVDGRKRRDEGSTAILFLDEAGNDRFLVGEGMAAQINGKIYSQEQRAVKGSAYGITMMDGSGNERGGFGFTALPAGGGRAMVSLDRPVGDAWGAWVDDKTGTVGMTFNYPMTLGEYQPGIEIGVQGERPFLHFKDKNDYPRAEMSLAPDGVPSLTISNEKGKEIGNLFRRTPQ